MATAAVFSSANGSKPKKKVETRLMTIRLILAVKLMVIYNKYNK